MDAEAQPPMPYQRVVVALDVMADSADSVVRRATQIAPGAELMALHVVYRPMLGVDIASSRELAALQESAMADAAERLKALCAPAGVADCVVRQGHAASEIRRYAAERGADVVVMGAHGRRGWRLLIGSTAAEVLHGRECDVLCVHIPGQAGRFGEILAAVDTAEQAPTVLARAAVVGATAQARVSVATVLRPLEYSYAGIDLSAYVDTATRMARDASGQAQARLDDLAAEFHLTGERVVRHGHPADEIHAR